MQSEYFWEFKVYSCFRYTLARPCVDDENLLNLCVDTGIALVNSFKAFEDGMCLGGKNAF